LAVERKNLKKLEDKEKALAEKNKARSAGC